MSIGDNDVPFLRVAGSPQDMGHKHGATFSPLIRSLFRSRMAILEQCCKPCAKSNIQETAEHLLLSLSEIDLDLFAEINAVAFAAGLSPWQLIVAGGYTDIIDILRPIQEAGPDHECTLAVDPAKGYIAGTWDSHLSARDSLIVLERHPDKGLATLALTTAGWPCQQGVNSQGLAFAITNLTPQCARSSGLIYIAANAVVAGARSVADACETFSKLRFCSGHSYVLTGGDGAGAIIETTGENSRVFHVNTLTTKANHYWGGKEAIDDNRSYAYLEGSLTREAELRKNLSGEIDPATFRLCLTRCNSVNRTDEKGNGVTCAHFVISARDRSLCYQKGPALLAGNMNRWHQRSLKS